ncbi:hypothetical protein BC833DRAFT_91186 [Globomyces pollinis-pini]|nr:hypothetical protein BC833DRAFT_91186 [Globomyces pollinis-pini]
MTTTTGSIESVSYKDEECCSICLESIRQQQEIPDKSPLLKLAHTTPSMVCLTPACHHIFHSFCLLRFLSSNITSNLCPNCRAPIRKDLNVFKLIYLPDSIFSVIKPTDIQPTTIQIQPAAPETTRLIRDLEARAVQIRDLELQLLQNANGADSDTDSDDANDAEFDNLNTLVQQQQEQISNLLCQVSKLEHDNSLLKKKKLDQTNECTELIKKNTALHQKQLEYKRTTELLQNKLKV